MGLEIDTASLERDILRTGRRLDGMTAKVQKAILRKSVRAAVAPLTKELKANAPATSGGDLRRTFGVMVRTLPAAVMAAAGQSKAKRKRRRAAHLHVVDQSTKPHAITGRFRGRDGVVREGTFAHPGTRGQEFVEQTAQSTLKKSLGIFAKKLAAEIEKEADGKR